MPQLKLIQGGYAETPKQSIQDKILALKLPLREREVLNKIYNLSQKQGYCYASNSFLAKIMGCPLETFRTALRKVRKKGLIKTTKCNGKRRMEIKLPDHKTGSAEPPQRVQRNHPNGFSGTTILGDDPERNIVFKKTIKCFPKKPENINGILEGYMPIKRTFVGFRGRIKNSMVKPISMREQIQNGDKPPEPEKVKKPIPVAIKLHASRITQFYEIRGTKYNPKYKYYENTLKSLRRLDRGTLFQYHHPDITKITPQEWDTVMDRLKISMDPEFFPVDKNQIPKHLDMFMLSPRAHTKSWFVKLLNAHPDKIATPKKDPLPEWTLELERWYCLLKGIDGIDTFTRNGLIDASYNIQKSFKLRGHTVSPKEQVRIATNLLMETVKDKRRIHPGYFSGRFFKEQLQPHLENRTVEANTKRTLQKWELEAHENRIKQERREREEAMM